MYLATICKMFKVQNTGQNTQKLPLNVGVIALTRGECLGYIGDWSYVVWYLYIASILGVLGITAPIPFLLASTSLYSGKYWLKNCRVTSFAIASFSWLKTSHVFESSRTYCWISVVPVIVVSYLKDKEWIYKDNSLNQGNFVVQ